MSEPKDPVEALKWAVQMQRGLAFNLGYLDLPMPDDEDLLPVNPTWQILFELLDVEYRLINDFIIRRMVEGEQLTPERTVAIYSDEEGDE